MSQQEEFLSKIDKFMMEELKMTPDKPANLSQLRDEVCKLQDELIRLKEDQLVSKLSSIKSIEQGLDKIIDNM